MGSRGIQFAIPVLLIVAGLLALEMHKKYVYDQTHCHEQFVQESTTEVRSTARSVEALFTRAYHGLRTIARLPGVRRITSETDVEFHGGGAGFDEDARATVQEIYNDLASAVAVSELYIVPVDFDPERVDPSTGDPMEPAVTFDEMIVGRTAAGHHDEHEHGEVEEVEEFEYRVMQEQIAWLLARHPTESSVDGMEYPSILGPEVVTCDNSRFHPEDPDDADRSGFVYSVPYYDPDGELGGIVSCVLLTHLVRDRLPNGDYAVLAPHHQLLAYAHHEGVAQESETWVRSGEENPDLPFSTTLSLGIRDSRGDWVLWSGRSHDEYHAHSGIGAIDRYALLSFVGLGAITTLLLATFVLFLRHERTDQRRRVALERAVEERTQELRVESERARAANRAKSEFLANMSHELRTPLNGVIGMTELMSRTSLDSRQKEFIETTRVSADTLLALINDVLDLSKIEAGKLDLEAIDFDLGEVVEHVVDIVTHRAHAKGLELSYFIAPEISRDLRGDPGRIQQVLLNLATNAVKFTEDGEISIQVEPAPRGDTELCEDLHDDTIRFSVRDTGIGIAPDDQNRLFQAFSQIDSSTTRRYGGTGLGLRISRQLVQLMGGTIGVDSTPGVGSTFFFDVELRPAVEASTRVPDADDMAALRDVRALVVDDNATNRRILFEQLTSWGLEVEGVDGPAAALQRLHSASDEGTPFEIAVLDMHMPGMTGEELAVAITQDSSLAPLRMIMLTSLGDASDGPRLLDIGFAAYLTKPVKSARLLETLTRVVTDAPLIDPEPEKPAPLPVRSLKVLLVDDNEINLRVAQSMLESLGHRVTSAHDGHSALIEVRRTQFDAILMDCQMPGMDGYEATRIIRQEETARGETTRVPIIALTANALSGAQDECLAAGMDDYLLKPVGLDPLRDALIRAVEPELDATN